jgi:omega-hydroxy-beta-dihydromenaquinone-9 sulfotransferase
MTKAASRSTAPIFIVGCGRSGTTVVYELLARDSSVAWISNYTERWPRFPQLAILGRLAASERIRHLDSRFLPRPREGHAAWDFLRPTDPKDRNRPLTGDDVDTAELDRIKRFVDAHVRYQGAQRFLNKNTRNSRRIPYLHSAFPHAFFIHVIRDPKAVVASLLEVGFWPNLPLWWRDDSTPRQLVDEGRSAASVAAEHWRRSVERLLADKELLPKDRYLELRYEDLVQDPSTMMSEICRFAQLDGSRIVQFALENVRQRRNQKYKSQLSEAELAIVSEHVEPLATRLGYSLRV